MTKLHVRNVFNIDPPHAELSLPLVLRPHARVRIIVDRASHTGHPAEVPASVHREEQVNDTTLPLPLAEGRIEALVTVLCAAPDFVLDAAMDVVLRVGLDNEESGKRGAQIELFRIIIVLDSQLVEHRMRCGPGGLHDGRRRGDGRRRHGRARGVRLVLRVRLVRRRRARRVRPRRRRLMLRRRAALQRRHARRGRRRRHGQLRGHGRRLQRRRRRRGHDGRALACVPRANVHVVLPRHDRRRRHARALLLQPAALRGRRRFRRLARYRRPRHLFGLRATRDVLELGHSILLRFVFAERERLHASLDRLDAIGHVKSFSSVVIVILFSAT